MSIKLIASDLDGTLMAPDHITVTERTFNALRAAHERGVKLAIATGRTLGFTGNVTEQLPFTDYVIYSNGAAVYDRNQSKVIYKNHISPEITEDILSLLSSMKLYYNCYVDGKIYVQRDKVQYYKNRSLPQEFLDLFVACSVECEDMHSTLRGQSAEIIAMYSLSAEQERRLTDRFRLHGLHVTSSLEGELEVTAPSVNKGTAIAGLCEAAGFSKNEVMCFGDALNDLEMLAFAEHSVAMGNAAQECKKAARHITATNAEDGVARAVEELVLK